MLSKCLKAFPSLSKGLAATQTRGFRSDFVNPYLHNPVDLSEFEKKKQEALPVWERTFDFQKYMHHEGPLKLTTGIAFLDVEPFPRMKLMKLYYLTLEEIKDLPDKYGYKFLSQEMTRYRMKIVDETLSVRQIEERVGYGMVEELIYAAHHELKLIRLMKHWKPWSFLYDDVDEKEDMLNMLNVRADQPFPTAWEDFSSMRHDRGARKPSANIHPEDSQQ